MEDGRASNERLNCDVQLEDLCQVANCCKCCNVQLGNVHIIVIKIERNEAENERGKFRS